MKRATVAAVLIFALSAMPLFAQAKIGAASPFFGTWRLNVAKSKYTPGPTPKSQVAKLEPIDGGMKVVSDRVEADGKMTHFEWSAKFDGKDGAVTGEPGGNAVFLMTIISTSKGGFHVPLVTQAAPKAQATTTANHSQIGKP